MVEAVSLILPFGLMIEDICDHETNSHGNNCDNLTANCIVHVLNVVVHSFLNALDICGQFRGDIAKYVHHCRCVGQIQCQPCLVSANNSPTGHLMSRRFMVDLDNVSTMC